MEVSLLDCLVHGWDIAKATGQSTDLPADASADALEAATMTVIDELRNMVGFDPAIEVAEDASAMAKLIAFCGRES